MRAAAVAIAIAACGGARETPTVTLSPLPRSPPSAATAAPLLAPRGAAPEILAPGEVTVVHFFASWCAPCAVSLPMLQQMKDAIGRVAVIGIGEDDEEPDTRAFVAKTSAKFPMEWDAGHAHAAVWRPATMPTTYVVDKHGVLRATYAGWTNDDVTAIVHEIDALVAAP